MLRPFDLLWSALGALAGWAAATCVYVVWWLATRPHDGPTQFVALTLFFACGAALTWVACLPLLARASTPPGPATCAFVGGVASTVVFLLIHGAWTEAWRSWTYVANAAGVGVIAGAVYGFGTRRRR
jgi:hypothetical protein